jgi:hypothetical protein
MSIDPELSKAQHQLFLCNKFQTRWRISLSIYIINNKITEKDFGSIRVLKMGLYIRPHSLCIYWPQLALFVYCQRYFHISR